MCLSCADRRILRRLPLAALLVWIGTTVSGALAANSNPTVTFTTNANQTSPAGKYFSLQLFTASDYTNLPNLFVTSQVSSSTNVTTRTNLDGTTNITTTVTYSSTNRYSNNLVNVAGSLLNLGGTNLVTNGLVFSPGSGLLAGTPTTNFILNFSSELVVRTTNRTWGVTNVQTNLIISVVSNGIPLPPRFTNVSSSSTNSSTNTSSTTNTNTGEFRLVFQRPAVVTNFPVTTIQVNGFTYLPDLNPLGLEYSYELISGDGSLGYDPDLDLDYLISTGVRPIVLQVTLAPPGDDDSLDIWQSNSARFTVTQTNPPADGFAFVTNTNLFLFTRTNLAFQQVTPLVVTNAGLARVSYSSSPGGRIFFSNHPTLPNRQIPYFLATSGTGISTVTATLAASATNASTTATVDIELQQPTNTIVMLGVFSNNTFTNTSPALTQVSLQAYTSPFPSQVDFFSSDETVARITNRTTLVLVGNGSCDIVAFVPYPVPSNYVGPTEVTNQLTVSWPPPAAPVFSSTNRQDGVEGVDYVYLLRAGPDTNAYPVTYGVDNLPPGLLFDGTNKIFGIPSQPGDFRIQLSATNTGGSTTNILRTVIAPASPFSVTNTNPWSYWVALGTGTNTNGGYTFVGGLPAGIGAVTNSSSTSPPVLVLSNANTNPAGGGGWFAGITNLSLTFSNSQTNFTASVPLDVRPPAPLMLAYPSFNSNNAGLPLQISGTITPTGVDAVPGYPVSFFASNLPAGVSINRTNGIFSGVPIAQNTTGTIWATNFSGSSATNTNVSFLIQPVAGVPLQRSLAFTNAAGTYEASNLPAGLFLLPSSGLLYGTPLYSGTNTNVVRFIAAGTGVVTTQTNVLVIFPAVPAITSSNRYEGILNTNFFYQLKANVAPCTFGVTNLPPGLSFTNGNQIVGIPTQPGTFLSQVTASNQTGTTTNVLTGLILPATNFSVTNGWTYRVSLGTGTNTNGAYTLATPLPAGIGSVTQSSSSAPPVLVLSNSNTNGNLIGAGSFAGITNLSVVFSNTLTNLTSLVSLDVRPVAPGLSLVSTVTGAAGAAFSLSVSGGVTPAGLTNVRGYPLAYVASNLPAGLSINPTSGVIAGTPAAVTRTAQIRVSNAVGGFTTNVTFQFQPVAGAALQISLASTNGPGTYRATNLPPGLFLTASNGLLFGSPQAVGTFPVNFTFTSAGSTTPVSQTTNLTILPPAPVLVLPAASVRGQAGQSFLFQPSITGPGWSWAGADPLTNPSVNSALWTNRLLVGGRTVVLSSNSNGAIVASTNGFTFTNTTNTNTTGLLWASNLPSSTGWQALLRMRLANTNPWAGPFLGIFRAPTNYPRQFVEAVLQAGTNAVLPGAWFGNTNATNSAFIATGVGTNEVLLRMTFNPTNQTVTVAVNTNPATNTFTNLLVSPNLQTGWGLTNPTSDFRMWLGGDFAGRVVQTGNVLLRNFAVLPGGLTFSASNLPPGIVCDPNTGTLYGVPTVAPASYLATLTASNAQGTNSRPILIEVIP